MKKYPKRGSFQDVKLNAEAVGFQIKESYKKARTNIAYSIVKKAVNGVYYKLFKIRRKDYYCS